MSANRTYTVSGMTCGHCVAAVKGEVGAVDGVSGVEIDLDSGRVDVSGGDDAAIREAIDEAGYDIVAA
ncbi:MAG: heavy-metal-associated domain-containing protein [Actinobacteria bacterium]|nr:heavy-metal-associated domain-containing protein [Actinomycetota bacterium]